MITTILIWAYTLVTAGLIGWAAVRLLQKVLNYEGGAPVPVTVQWLAWLAALTCIFSFLSLVMPLGFAAQVIVLALSLLALVFWARPHPITVSRFVSQLQRQPAPVMVLLAIAAATVLILAVAKPENFDTGLYHAQAIHWIETYPAVPGLANFASRLGFNSSWLLTQALFSFAFLGIQSFHLNTSVLCLAAVFYFGAGVRSLWKGSHRTSDWMRALFFPLIFYVLSSEVSSPGNDAPVAVITWIVAAEWLSFLEDGWPERDLRPVLLTLISVYAVTMKLSAIPLVLIGGVVRGRSLLRHNWRATLAAAGLGVLFLIPWMARSVVLTGYLVYPVPAVDLFAVDWKIPAGDVRDTAEVIRDWAYLPRQDVQRVESLSFRALTAEWFANQTANRRGILLIDLAAPFGFLGLALVGKLRPFLLRLFKSTWPVWLMTYAGLGYWFFSAPDFRFGEGFILTALAMAAAPLFVLFRKNGSGLDVIYPGW